MIKRREQKICEILINTNIKISMWHLLHIRSKSWIYPRQKASRPIRNGLFGHITIPNKDIYTLENAQQRIREVKCTSVEFSAQRSSSVELICRAKSADKWMSLCARFSFTVFRTQSGWEIVRWISVKLKD